MAGSTLKTARCTGHCCRSFTLPFSPDELSAAAAKSAALKAVIGANNSIHNDESLHNYAHENGGDKLKAYTKLRETYGANFYDGFKDFCEVEVIADMVIYLGYGLMNEHQASQIPSAQKILDSEKAHSYTCKHLVDGKECGIYPSRPEMCRTYPYGNSCRYKGCTSDTAEKRDSLRSAAPNRGC